ncbi:hypothetical protein AMAG_00217 [Allomyces macrogynus ATCC 38327]|uniref:Uncharacterized protein n=1 Tax=Allomyces macrogynus (strain ATCC 38327) TaxID=578462 RepID=A0A0L0RVV9_ALLM3|nr:hypothetical protein AMAG_00217 [Allomyces macrogynus ATCC 38327]|eukprot:KNE54226.1 hypothetical protein AMAG_00217 [Allomyces macrogynus ATCC 38327]
MANLRTPARLTLLAVIAILLLAVHADPHPDPHASPDPHALADPVPLVVPARAPPLVRSGDDTITSVVADILDDSAAPEDVKAGLGDAIEVPGATEAIEPLLGNEKEEPVTEPVPPAETADKAEEPTEANEVEVPLLMVDDTEGGNEEEEPAPAVPEVTQDAPLDETQEATQIDAKDTESRPLRAREAMFQDAAEPVADPDTASNAAATPNNNGNNNNNNNNGKPTTTPTPSRSTGTVEASLVPSTTTTSTATATATGSLPDSYVDGGQLNLVFAAVAMNKGPNGQAAPSFQLTSDQSGLSFSAQYAV